MDTKLDANQHQMSQGMGSAWHISTAIESITAPGGLKSHAVLGCPAISAN
jgi:hypothetical protein